MLSRALLHKGCGRALNSCTNTILAQKRELLIGVCSACTSDNCSVHVHQCWCSAGCLRKNQCAIVRADSALVCGINLLDTAFSSTGAASLLLQGSGAFWSVSVRPYEGHLLVTPVAMAGKC